MKTVLPASMGRPMAGAAARSGPGPAAPARRRAGRDQRGAAALVVVLMLFFVVALVAAYTSRNLIFEQRTSVNQLRSTTAFETAEAGLEWAVAQLNGGRIGDDCQSATATAISPSFRQRFLRVDPATGLWTPRTRSSGQPLYATCVWSGTDWRCDCPIDAAPSLAAPAGTALAPAFRVRFTLQDVTRPGVVRVDVNGCMRLDDNCLNEFGDNPVESEGRSQHTALVALKSALTTVPAAALTVMGEVHPLASPNLLNTDPATGLTLHSAGPAPTPDPNRYRGVPGTPAIRTVLRDDGALPPAGMTLSTGTAAQQLMPTPADTDPERLAKWERVFAITHGLLPASHLEQPAALRMPCPPTGCRQALADLAAANPGRVIWIIQPDGSPSDLTLESAGTIGSMPDFANPASPGPVSLVVSGSVRVLAAGVRVVGMVQVRSFSADPSATPWSGEGEVQGAVLIEGNLGDVASPTVIYDPVVLAGLRRGSGSFVRLPGDWRDYREVGP